MSSGCIGCELPTADPHPSGGKTASWCEYNGKKTDENGNPYIMTSPWFYKPEWDSKIEKEHYSKELGGKINKFDTGGPIKDYNAVLYNGEITAPIEEISITGNSGLTNYKPGTKDYINQIRKFTDRIYSGDLAIDAVPEYYRKGVQHFKRRPVC